MPVSRIVAFGAGLFCGSYCLVAAFRNGQSLGNGSMIDSTAFGIAFAAVVVGHWPLLGLADRERGLLKRYALRLLWALCVVFVLVNDIGYFASHRTETIESRGQAINEYGMARSEVERINGRLSAMKDNRRWDSTDGCTNATVPKSKAFCEDWRAARVALKEARATVREGKPATRDPQSVIFAWLSGMDQSWVSHVLPIFWSMVLTLATPLLFYAAQNSETPKQSQPEQKSQKTATKPKPKARQQRKSSPASKAGGIIKTVDGRGSWRKLRQAAND